MPTKKVRLIRPWSGHAAGEIIEEWVVTADSMIRKGFAVAYVPETHRTPMAETATAPSPPEAAVLTPQINKRHRGRSPIVPSGDKET